MFTAISDFIIKFVNALFSSKDSILKQKRDRRDRIAQYLDELSVTLFDVAEELKKGNKPWHQYHELSFVLANFSNIVEGALDDEQVLALYRELQSALMIDYPLIYNPNQMAIVDAIFVRELEKRLYTGVFQGPLTKELTNKELELIILDEINKLYKASGMFKAASLELKAM